MYKAVMEKHGLQFTLDVDWKWKRYTDTPKLFRDIDEAYMACGGHPGYAKPGWISKLYKVGEEPSYGKFKPLYSTQYKHK